MSGDPTYFWFTRLGVAAIRPKQLHAEQIAHPGRDRVRSAPDPCGQRLPTDQKGRRARNESKDDEQKSRNLQKKHARFFANCGIVDWLERMRALIPRAPNEKRWIPLRNLTILVTVLAATILLIALSADPVEFYLPVIGAAAVLLFTLVLASNPTDDVRPSKRRDETERHRW
jgi:hypothetical protein